MNPKYLFPIIVLLLLSLPSQAHIRYDPNEQCSWRGYKTCPIESSGSNPICDSTTPTEVSPGIYGLRVCASETPKFIGGKFEVGLALFGVILTVDVIPTESDGENNQNCSSGQDSVGQRVF